jgi:hypothetical protein
MRRAKEEKGNDVSWKEKKKCDQKEGLKYNTLTYYEIGVYALFILEAKAVSDSGSINFQIF